MTTLNNYFSMGNSYHPTPENNNSIIVRATIPPFIEEKIKRIIEVKGYTSYQDYFNTLFNENKELKDIIIPYEILKIIDEDYNSITGRYM